MTERSYHFITVKGSHVGGGMSKGTVMFEVV